MKKIIMATALAALIPLSSGAFAADTGTGNATNSANQTKSHAAGKMIHDQMEADAVRLKLTPEQKSKIADVVKEHKKDLDEDIRDELDDSQKLEFDKIQAEHKAAWGSKTQ